VSGDTLQVKGFRLQGCYVNYADGAPSRLLCSQTAGRLCLMPKTGSQSKAGSSDADETLQLSELAKSTTLLVRASSGRLNLFSDEKGPVVCEFLEK
jgi:hypothetical protein